MADGPRGLGLPGVRVVGPAAAPKPAASSARTDRAIAPDLLAFRPDPSRMERAGPRNLQSRTRAPIGRQVATCHHPAQLRLDEADRRTTAGLDPEALNIAKRACRRLSPRAWAKVLRRFLAAIERAQRHHPARLRTRDRRLSAHWGFEPWYALDPSRLAAPDRPAQANLRSAANGLVYLEDLTVQNVRLGEPAPDGPALHDLLRRACQLGLRMTIPLEPRGAKAHPVDALFGLLPRLAAGLRAGAVGFSATGVDRWARDLDHCHAMLTLCKLFARAVCPRAAVLPEPTRTSDAPGAWVGAAWADDSTEGDLVRWSALTRSLQATLRPPLPDPRAALCDPPAPLHGAAPLVDVPPLRDPRAARCDPPPPLHGAAPVVDVPSLHDPRAVLCDPPTLLHGAAPLVDVPLGADPTEVRLALALAIASPAVPMIGTGAELGLGEGPLSTHRLALATQASDGTARELRRLLAWRASQPALQTRRAVHLEISGGVGWLRPGPGRAPSVLFVANPSAEVAHVRVEGWSDIVDPDTMRTDGRLDGDLGQRLALGGWVAGQASLQADGLTLSPGGFAWVVMAPYRALRPRLGRSR